MKDSDLIKRGDVFALTTKRNNVWDIVTDASGRGLTEIVNSIPAVDAVEVDTVCEMMEFLFDDSCPCNYNSIDEWLPYVCEQQEECPKPTDKYGCWKQFIKHFGKRREEEHNAAD